MPEGYRELRQPTHAQLLIWSQVGPEPLRHLEAWRGEAIPQALFRGQTRASEGLWPASLGFAPRRMGGSPQGARGQRWDLLFTAGDDALQRALLALRARAAKEGVELVLRPLDAALFFERLMKGDFQLACALKPFDPHPWSVLELLEPQGSLNVTGWRDPRVPGILPRLDHPGGPAWEELQAIWAERPATLRLLGLGPGPQHDSLGQLLQEELPRLGTDPTLLTWASLAVVLALAAASNPPSRKESP